MLAVHVITFTTSLSMFPLLVTLRTVVLVAAPEVRATVVPADEAVTLVLAVQVQVAVAAKIASEAVSVRILVAATVSLGVNANTRSPGAASLLTVLVPRVTPASADVTAATVV